ncbi:hypothetical protein M378DRAFT_187405 [Amanita muscaria Koide BX008]|uniref:Uncharacterized protein n=1 Tax=Amanita muscaria (strain Koide BX008) TaxID=946122 RepID=A0A0C2X0J9_AMAMK|nr:hypothetical protein M378DRAFT_187405 [Amanita muscaria Koide BX008]
MAVLVPKDWPMDISSNNPSSSQRSDPNHHTTSSSHQHHPPYPYPLRQQPQGSWTPSIAAPPFYPSFFQNPHQQQPPQAFAHPIPQQFPQFDPTNAQLAAQWAYQQMMFNAQHGFSPMQNPQHRSAPNSASNEYFPSNQVPFNPFPSGTPPPRPNNSSDPSPNNQYAGFHPYRRPPRQNASSHASEPSDWRPGTTPGPFPPYARPEATGSTSSISSTSSQRQRTTSNQSVHSSHNTSSPNGSVRGRPSNGARSAAPPSSAPTPAAPTARVPHNRNLSSSSSTSTATTSSTRPPALSPSMSSATTSTTTTSTSATVISSATPRPARPSPLSQGNFTAAEKRMSRDDSDLPNMLESTHQPSGRSGGLKGRLRRALSFNVLKEEEAEDAAKSVKAGKQKAKAPASPDTPAGNAAAVSGTESGAEDAASTATVQTKKKSRAASLFNSRFNASTDNISLSSTVSSASVMIRKLGSMGKIARRNSLAGIASLFKDKDKEKDKGKKDKKTTAKAGASEAIVSHVTAELDRMGNGDWSVDLQGLSPAAKLARQHTLKSNAEAAAKVKAQEEAQAAAAAAAAAAATATAMELTQNLDVNGTSGVPTWERGTTNRQAVSPVKSGAVRVSEDGTRVVVEDDEDESDDGHYNPTGEGHSFNIDGWDDDEDWDVDPDGDEDVTIRATLETTHIEDEVEPWAVGVRRSIERAKRPSRGILKYSDKYDQETYLAVHQPTQIRPRSNSYNSHPGSSSELGPLAHIPSPDPDHIDGLHRHNSHSSGGHGNNNSAGSSLQPLPLVSSAPIGMTIFQNPSMNSSAPTLSLSLSSSPAPMPHRSATSPGKRLAFASNLSVYDTFSSAIYDRRSEPATWSRLTPSLAQRIKEELNSYKMEEMEVHAASRIHTQFFV